MPRVIADAEVDKVSQNALGTGTRPLCDPSGTSSLETSFIASEKVRKNLQKDYLTHLESIEPPDHNSMLQAVNDTSDASVSQVIECRSFVKNLEESFRGISMVAGMESALKDSFNQSVSSLLKNIGKSLYDISGNNAEAFATVTDTGNYHIRSVYETASHIEDKLCQIEKLETHLLKTAKDVGQLKSCMQATFQELTKTLKEVQMHFNKDNIK